MSEIDYLNSIDEIMDAYNEQVHKIEKISSSVSEKESNLIQIDDDFEEFLRNSYNEDYGQNNELVSFEKYKQDMMDLTKHKSDSATYDKDEYYANLYYLIDIKKETKETINKRKSQLELLLSEVRMKISFDKCFQKDISNLLESESKIEQALQKLLHMMEKIELTKEEIGLMMSGLSFSQKQIYESLLNDLNNQKSNEYNAEVKDKFEEKVEPIINSSDIDINEEFKEKDKYESIIINSDNLAEDIAINPLTLEGIIYKVCGDRSFNNIQSSKYVASKIKVYMKLENNNLEGIRKFISISKSVIGIIPRSVIKAYGGLMTKSTKQAFASMEIRANNLTDEEVEILLAQYKDITDTTFELPRGFIDAVKPRVNIYVSKKLSTINKQITEFSSNIFCCEKVILALKEKISSEQSPEMVATINETINNVYGKAYFYIKDLILLQSQQSHLQKTSKLHGFKDELKQIASKLTYLGGMFIKSREYDPILMSKVSGYSQKIEYSLDIREVVDSYIKREEVYKEYAKKKGIVSNLDNKIMGDFDYDSFIEDINYTNSPVIKNLLEIALNLKEEKANTVEQAVTSNFNGVIPVVNNDQEEKNSKRRQEVREMIESLKVLKAELSEEDVKEIENLLK